MVLPRKDERASLSLEAMKVVRLHDEISQKTKATKTRIETAPLESTVEVGKLVRDIKKVKAKLGSFTE